MNSFSSSEEESKRERVRLWDCTTSSPFLLHLLLLLLLHLLSGT